MADSKAVVTDDRYDGDYDAERSILSAHDIDLAVTHCTTPAAVLSACSDADAILCNLAPVTADVVAGLDRCKVIARYGVGYDNIDVDACTRRGIQVTNVTDYCAEEVSDHALALLMACARKVARRDAQVRAGIWNVGRKDPVYRLAGKTFAFLGFGMIARCLLRKIRGLNFAEILVVDPYVDQDQVAAEGCRAAGLDEALGEADILSLHMPVTEDTREVIDTAALSRMKPTAILVNTARGALIDEQALAQALRSHTINSAGLDVHASEPLPDDSPLRALENCVLTDHTAWYSEESMQELKQKVARNVVDVMAGRRPAYPVNKVKGRPEGS